MNSYNAKYESTDAYLTRKFKEEREVLDHKNKHTKLEHNVEDIFVMLERVIKKLDEIESRLDNTAK